MKKSKYSYFFEIDDEYVGYSYITDKFIAFSLEQKPEVDRIIEYPDDIITNADVDKFYCKWIERLVEVKSFTPLECNLEESLIEVNYSDKEESDEGEWFWKA